MTLIMSPKAKSTLESLTHYVGISTNLIGRNFSKKILKDYKNASYFKRFWHIV